MSEEEEMVIAFVRRVAFLFYELSACYLIGAVALLHFHISKLHMCVPFFFNEGWCFNHFMEMLTWGSSLVHVLNFYCFGFIRWA